MKFQTDVVAWLTVYVVIARGIALRLGDGELPFAHRSRSRPDPADMPSREYHSGQIW